MKRILSLILAMLMIVGCLAFTACGEEKPNDDNNGEKESDTDKNDSEDGEDGEDSNIEDFQLVLSDEPLEVPEDLDYTGYTFRISTPNPWGEKRFVREELNNDPINDSLFNMNQAVYDYLGVKLEAPMEQYTHNQSQVFIDSVLAGDHKFDVMAMHSTSTCAALIIADAVLSFDYLEYCDLTKPWWDHNFLEASSILGNNFFAVSSSCYYMYMNTNVLLFNKDLAEEYNLPDLYELVRKDQWTVDKMIELTKNFSQDLNSDGVYDVNDQLALISDNGPHIVAWMGAFRQSTTEKGENDEPVITVGSQRMTKIVEKLNTLYNTGRRAQIYPIHDREFGDDEYNKAFAEGRVLFNVCYVENATKMRDYDINFGIIPLPKLDEDQEKYGAFVDAWHLTFAVPIDAEDPERTSAVLETMAYYSYHYTYPAIIQQAIYGTGTRDTESIEMLELIYKNLYYDFGYLYNSNGEGYASILTSLIPVGSIDLQSSIQGKKNSAEKHFADLYDAILANYAG